MAFIKKIKRCGIDLYKTLKLYRNYYYCPFSAIHKCTTIICMIDGKTIHGGLSDRLWGILSTYKYCKENNLNFKLNFTSPYNLDIFLVPNQYDWRISPSEINYNLSNVRPVYISMFYRNCEAMKCHLEKKLKTNLSQLHVYTNCRSFPYDEFHKLFYELFCFTPLVTEAINKNLARIGGEYVSITFRFQQLLGDFIEGNYPVLQNNDDKKKLINRCIDLIVNLKKKKKLKILVTSDSISFLNEASKLENVFIIPGKIVHVDFNAQEASQNVHLKSFVDLFMISHASEVYLANIKPLYRSGFPETAALIGNKQYFEIDN